MRYTTVTILKDKDGKRYYKPIIVKEIPLKDSDLYIYPFPGDRFDMLAQRYYGDSNLWWIILGIEKLKIDLSGKTANQVRSILSSILPEYKPDIAKNEPFYLELKAEA